LSRQEKRFVSFFEEEEVEVGLEQWEEEVEDGLEQWEEVEGVVK
jgi:hypothetical protein